MSQSQSKTNTCSRESQARENSSEPITVDLAFAFHSLLNVASSFPANRARNNSRVSLVRFCLFSYTVKLKEQLVWFFYRVHHRDRELANFIRVE